MAARTSSEQTNVSEWVAWVEQAQKGDANSIRILCEYFNYRVNNYLVKVLGNREDAEDARIETFVRAFRSLPSLENASAFESWLFRIAYHEALRLRGGRSRIPLVQLPDDDPEGFLDSIAERIAFNRSRAEQEQMLSLLLSRLKPDEQLLCHLWLEGYTQVEIAQGLRVTREAVRHRLSCVRKKIKGLLEVSEGENR